MTEVEEEITLNQEKYVDKQKSKEFYKNIRIQNKEIFSYGNTPEV